MSQEQFFDLIKTLLTAIITSIIASVFAPLLQQYIKDNIEKKKTQPKVLTPFSNDDENKYKKRRLQKKIFFIVFIVSTFTGFIALNFRNYGRNPYEIATETSSPAITTNSTETIIPSITTSRPQAVSTFACTKNYPIFKGARVIVNSSKSINIRKIPGLESPIVTTAPDKTKLLVSSESICVDWIEWWEVTNESGNIRGWVAGYLIILDK